MLRFAMLMAAAYLLGSVNFSILLFRIMKKGDPRQKFSGNPGATNVYRQAGPLWAAVVLALDMGRAAFTAWLALTFSGAVDRVSWIGLGLILGNRLPCFHGFRGGKGVANYLGFTAVLTPVSTLLSACAWGLGFAAWRTPFIGSFLMVLVLAGGTTLAFPLSPMGIAGVWCTAMLIFFNHRQNIKDALTKPGR